MYELRLTVIGPQAAVARFQRRQWLRPLAGRSLEPLELGPCRYVCQFTLDRIDLPRWQRLARRWPQLVFLLDYDGHRTKGVAKLHAGAREHCELGY